MWEVANENTGVQFAIEQIPTSVFKQCFRKTFESYNLVCIVQFICLSDNCINAKTICKNNDGAPRPGRQSSSLRVFCAAGQRALQHRRYGAHPAMHRLGPRASRELARISLDDEDRGPGKCPHVQDIGTLAILAVLFICISYSSFLTIQLTTPFCQNDYVARLVGLCLVSTVIGLSHEVWF